MNAPLIALLTDFGWCGPYVGQVKAVLAVDVPEISVIDLMHDAPPFDIQASAFLLASVTEALPFGSVILAVVDSGVGTDTRKPVILQADGRWYVGPGNGIFNVVAKRARELAWWDIDYRPKKLSASFHGRDLFAPVAAIIARGDDPPGTSALPAGRIPADWPDELWRVIFIDRFGNAATGIRAQNISTEEILELRGTEFPHARIFGEADPGRGFWYQNSNGLVEIALREGNAAERFEITVGTEVLRGEP